MGNTALARDKEGGCPYGFRVVNETDGKAVLIRGNIPAAQSGPYTLSYDARARSRFA